MPPRNDSSVGKRVFDLGLALALAAPALLLSLIAGLAVFAEMGANPLFLQRRVGRDGRPFTIVKLRTMRPDTPHGASHEIGQSGVTRLGFLLRRTKLDELPQLWNVLVGEMSLVGPRPCLPSQTELVAAREARGVLVLRPGITGPAQIAGIDMSRPQALAAADAAYLGAWSLRRDFAILWETVTGAGAGDAARAP